VIGELKDTVSIHGFHPKGCRRRVRARNDFYTPQFLWRLRLSRSVADSPGLSGNQERVGARSLCAVAGVAQVDAEGDKNDWNDKGMGRV